LAKAIETVEAACAADIDKFCGNVTRGEGRVIVSMRAHDDKLSRRCQFALYRVSRNLEGALDRVERVADACWNDIQAHCQDADSIARCVMEEGPTLSPACKSVVAGLRRTLQGLASLKGMPAFSASSCRVLSAAETTVRLGCAQESLQGSGGVPPWRHQCSYQSLLGVHPECAPVMLVAVRPDGANHQWRRVPPG
jgi:hypothetical protein